MFEAQTEERIIMAEQTDRETNVHWADQVAEQALASGREPVISTGISPSGEVHIGNMREVVTGDAVFRVLRELGAPARFNYVADNLDPLRRVYPFLDAAVYEPLVGRPICAIPCPCGEHSSYSEHFLEPFLRELAQLGVEVEVERADEMYASGRMTPFVVRALERRDQIAEILRELTGKEVSADWSPFNALCPACGRMTQAKVLGFSAADESVDYGCACGSAGTIPIAGGGKLVWRIDWPARWKMLGVTIEPFGKDHSTRGGSYDTGVRIVREVFDGEPPLPIPYEWIRLKGQGDMSSSRGNVLSIGRVLAVVPPEALRYLVIRERPQRTINFDPGEPLLQLVDDIEDASVAESDQRSVALSRAGRFLPVGVPSRHLLMVAQAAGFDEDETLAILKRTGYPEVGREAVVGRMAYLRRWREEFAPERLRFEVQPTLPEEAAELTTLQRSFLGQLAGRLREGQDGQAINDVIWEVANGFEDVKPAELFRAIYLVVLGKPKGPRAGSFLSVLGVEFAARRFSEAARTDS
jgi:lysyl-tRNA synthetase class 1